MKLVKYTRRIPRLGQYDDMSRLFDQLWLRPLGETTLYDRSWSPAFEIRETGDEYRFEAALPGLTKKDIKVTLQDGVLSISGERQERETGQGETVHTREFRYGAFSRSFNLPTEVDEEKVDARYKDGMLTIAVKKLEPVEPERRQIAVK